MYTVAIYFFDLILRVYGLFNPKIQKWNHDRKNHLDLVLSGESSQALASKKIWFHCSSLGEFEQARYVIDKLSQHQDIFIYLSFFSPSGFEIRKKYTHADHVFYLPLDQPGKMAALVNAIRPDLFVGVKYDHWWNLYSQLNKKHIPKFLIALKYDQKPYFLKFPFRFLGSSLRQNTYFYTQDGPTTNLLRSWYPDEPVSTAGDPRISGILERKSDLSKIHPLVRKLASESRTWVYASIYPECMVCLQQYIQENSDFHVLVPHDVSDSNIRQISSELNTDFVLYSQLDHLSDIPPKCIIIDQVGLLFDLYELAHATYVGGGFNKNVHNTLEPARLGIPIAIGPKHQGFTEVDYFLKNALIAEIADAASFGHFVSKANDLNYRSNINQGQKSFMAANSQAGTVIYKAILEKIQSE